MGELPVLIAAAAVGSTVLLGLLARDWWARRRLLRHVEEPAGAAGAGAGRTAGEPRGVDGLRGAGGLRSVARRGRRAVAAYPVPSGVLGLAVVAFAGLLLWGPGASPGDGRAPDAADPQAAASEPPQTRDSDASSEPPSAAQESGGDDARTLEADAESEGDGGDTASAPDSTQEGGDASGGSSGQSGSSSAEESGAPDAPSAEESRESSSGRNSGSGGGDGASEGSADEGVDCGLLHLEVDLLVNVNVCL